MDVHEFLNEISIGLKNPITKEEVFGKEMKLSHLKRIDKIFERGINYYLDTNKPVNSKEASIFFRKQNFNNGVINLSARKLVNKYEKLKHSLSGITKLCDLDVKRKIKKYSIYENPIDIAIQIREIIYPKFENNRRDFLKSLISSFANVNILVFEFIETWNKKEKANIDGFYLNPNMIVLKRHQSFSREIFTLAHELGHYLLDEEEFEEINFAVNYNFSSIEKWCNEFAFFFLAGSYSDIIEKLDIASSENNYHHKVIESISKNTHISKLALFTRLLYTGKISKKNYTLVKNEFDELYKQKQEIREREKQLLKEKGIVQKGSVAKPILSPLFVSTMQNAYYEGVINEYEFCKKLNIKPSKLEHYI